MTGLRGRLLSPWITVERENNILEFLLGCDVDRSVVRHTVYAGVCVQIFVHRDLEHGCTSIPMGAVKLVTESTRTEVLTLR